MKKDRYEVLDSLAKDIMKKYPEVSSVLAPRPDQTDAVDILFLIDDLNNVTLNQRVEEVRLAATELAYSSKLTLKIEVMLASDFWDALGTTEGGSRKILRSCLIIEDNGFLLPIQDLLVKGKIRPSKESVDVYYVKAERSMKTANDKVKRAVVDLYWAVTDAAHAAMMVSGITPPNPRDLPELIRKELILRNLVHRRCGDIYERIYSAAKDIIHKKVFEVSGRQLDSYFSDADFFIREMDSFVREHVSRNDTAAGAERGGG